MPIRVLTPEVATKIAAGEVVERPASVVKELLENSIDAGATEVSIEVQGGGVDYIRVADNGCGIAKEEIPLAFQRYATSKLHDSQDLESIATMGFRGEALPSIAAVSQVALLSRPASQTSGALIEVAEGQVVREEAQGAPQGTVVTVQHLFRFFPPRRKFLRSAVSEASRIQAVVTHYAMAYPEIRFSLVADGANTFLHAGSGSLRDAIAAVYGSEVAEAMLDLSPVIGPDERQELSVTGLLSPPSLSRANRSYISFFVNRRWVQSRLLGYSLEQAYQGFLMEHRHPIAAVNISIPFQEVDVNVHPAKSEVRFRWENQVFSALQKAVRQTLTALSPVPEFHLGPPTQSFAPPQRPGVPSWPASWPVQEQASQLEEVPSTIPLLPRAALPVLRVLGQVQNTYLAAEGPDGMYLIDQHAAHERVLFEQVTEELRQGEASVQSLLEPVPLEVTPQQGELLNEHQELLQGAGFLAEPFGPNSYLLRGVPGVLAGMSPQEALLHVLDLMAEGGGFKQWEERLAYSIACHGAIRAGKVLSSEEMWALVKKLESTQQPHTCPHGRPTIIHLSSSHLEREFGRR